MDSFIKSTATKLIWDDHQRLRQLHQKGAEETDLADKAKLVENLLQDLEIHLRLEERLLYPALVEEGLLPAVVGQFGQDHGELRRLISDYRLAQGLDPALHLTSPSALARILATFEHHVAEVETRALPVLSANPARNEDLGMELNKLKLKLTTFPPLAKTIEVAVPLSVAYNLWTQFESFPNFLEHITSVRQLDDTHLQWKMEQGGKETQWTAEIYEQIPDQRIAWSTVSGAPNTGSVSFQARGPYATRILVEITYEPQGILEDLGALIGLLSRTVSRDLESLKRYLESTAQASEGWRGRVQGNPVEPQL